MQWNRPTGRLVFHSASLSVYDHPELAKILVNRRYGKICWDQQAIQISTSPHDTGSLAFPKGLLPDGWAQHRVDEIVCAANTERSDLLIRQCQRTDHHCAQIGDKELVASRFGFNQERETLGVGQPTNAGDDRAVSIGRPT